MHFNKLNILTIITACTLLSGCGALGLATSVGAVGGIAAAREGGLSQSATDARISLEISDLWLKYDFDAFRKLNLTVEQGRVLVTGVVQDPDMRVEAVRLAWQPRGVLQVINEVRVENSDGVAGYARDTWISSSLRSKMILDRDIQSINYSIEAVQATVYLMGIAQDQAELNKVIALARSTGYVRQVVSYVKLAGDPVEGVQDPIAIAPTPTSPSGRLYNYDGGDYSSGSSSDISTPMPVTSMPVKTDNSVYSEPLYN